MRDRFNSVDDILQSDFYKKPSSTPPQSDRIILSSRLQNEIFREILGDNPDLKEIQQKGQKQLSTFDSLVKDIFSACYSVTVKKEDEDLLIPKVKQFNLHILDDLLSNPQYIVIKSVCEGRELPAFDACEEFCRIIFERLPDLLKSAGGGQDCMNVIDTLQTQVEQLKNELHNLMQSKNRPEQQITRIANRLQSKQNQIEALFQKITDNMVKSGEQFKAVVSEAAQSAVEKAQETANAVKAWGDGSVEMGNTPINKEILRKVKSSAQLSAVAKILGKYREILADKRKNSFTYGLGEKYDITTGDNINQCLSSDLALLAASETQPLFIRKYEQQNLKQFRKRGRIAKGAGDIICCVDESSSMDDVIDWAKALSIALLDVTAKDKRRFALVHFASSSKTRTDIFEPGQYSIDDVLSAAEHYFRGGTDFETPLNAAIDLLQNGFENADIIFITDGDCEISKTYAEQLTEFMQTKKFEITGILVDTENSTAGKSLIPFCDRIYRSSEFSNDEIFMKVISQKV